MRMFPYIENSRFILFFYGRRPGKSLRLILAMVLSILAHAIVLWPANSMVSARDGGVVATHIVAQLVDPRTGRSPEGVDPVQGASEEQAEAVGRRPQNQSGDISAASAPPQKEGSLLQGKDSGIGVEASGAPYFSSELLTVRPYPITQFESPDLRRTLQKGSLGRVVLRVWVSDTGEVSGTETEASDMPPAEHEAVIAAFQRMRFKPGEMHGKPVGSIMRIEMSYDDLRLSVTE